MVLCLFAEDSAPVELMSLALRADGAGDAMCRLGPLDVEAVARIAALYTGDGPPLAAAAVHAATAGRPGHVHEVAAEWALGEARDRLGVAAQRASGQRRSARATENYLSEAVLQLQLTSEQARVFVADGERTEPDVSPFKGLATFESTDASGLLRTRAAGSRADGAPHQLIACRRDRSVGKRQVLGRAGGIATCACRRGCCPEASTGSSASCALASIRCAALDEALADLGQEGLLLFIDQFEELFTSAIDANEPSAFVERLVGVVRGDSNVRVVLALRADYYGHCAAYPQLAGLLGDDHVLVGAMHEDELRRVIELPARRAGLRVEPELTDALISDVVAEPGGLPLLSTALLELWQLRDGRHMRLEHYEATGGVQGAVGRLAETTFDHLTPSQREAGRRVLLRLAGVGEGDAVVRRRAPLEEFEADRDKDVAAVLDVFTRDRLLTTSDGTVEVAHEALFRQWPRLTAWLAEDAQGRVVHASLRDAARDWAARGRDASELYRGARLASTLEWSDEHPEQLNELERDFLAHSRRAGQQELRSARRANRRLRGLLIGVASLLALAVVAAIVALNERQGARHAAVVADSQRLGAQAQLETRLDRGLLLARQAVALDDSVQSRGYLFSALARNPDAVSVVRSPGGTLTYLDISPDGREFATGDDRGNVAFFDARSGERSRPQLSMGSLVGQMEYSRRGNALAVAVLDGSVSILDRHTHRLIARLSAADIGVNPDRGRAGAGFQFAPDGRSLVVAVSSQTQTQLVRWRKARRGLVRAASASVGFRAGFAFVQGGRRILVWGSQAIGGEARLELRDARTLALTRRLPHRSLQAAASRDGRRIAFGEADGSIRVADIRQPRVARLLGRHPGDLGGLTFTSRGDRLVSTGGRDIVVWDVAAGRRERTFTSPAPTTVPGKISPDGRTLYTLAPTGAIAWDLSATRGLNRQVTLGPPVRAVDLSLDGRAATAVVGDDVIVRDAATLRIRAKASVPDHIKPLNSVTVSPDGRTVALAGSGGIWLWSLAERRIVARRLTDVASDQYNGSIFSPDGKTVVTYANDGDRFLRLWSVRTRRQLGTFRPSSQSSTATFSPDGRRLAIGRKDGVVEIRRASTGKLLRSWRAEVADPVIAWSPDARLVATSGSAGARLWDVSTGRPAGRAFSEPSNTITALDFSPDGRRLASQNFDGVLQVHDVQSRRDIGPGVLGPASQGMIEFSSDGSRLTAFTYSNEIVRLDVSPRSWQRRACAIAGRSLTRAEWEQFLPGRDYDPACTSERGG